MGWSEVMFIFDEKTKFNDIINNPSTHFLTRDNFIGVYEFDKNFIKFFNVGKIGERNFFYRFSYHKDELTTEQIQWQMVPQIEPKEEVKEHKEIIVKNNDFSDASDFQSLFD